MGFARIISDFFCIQIIARFGISRGPSCVYSIIVLAFRSRVICPIVFRIPSVVDTLRGVKIPSSKRGDNNARAENIPWVQSSL